MSELWANQTKKSNGSAHTSILTTFRLIPKRDQKADSKSVGDTAGRDTVLRVFRFNKETGIVSDEVEELKLQPNNWGEIAF